MYLRNEGKRMKIKRLVLLVFANFVLTGCVRADKEYKEVDSSTAKKQIEAMKSEINKDSFAVPEKLTVNTKVSMNIKSSILSYDSEAGSTEVFDKTSGKQYYYQEYNSAQSKMNIWLYLDGDKYIYATETSSIKQYIEYDLETGEEKFASLADVCDKEHLISCLDTAATLIDSSEDTTENTQYKDMKIYAKNGFDLKMETNFSSESNEITTEGSETIVFESCLITKVSQNAVYGGSMEGSTISTDGTYDWGAAKRTYPNLTNFTKNS